MDDRFFEAWISRNDWRVCGLRMQPLCLGHIINLAAIGSPLLPGCNDEDLRIGVADLLLAAKICAERYPHPANLRPRLRDVGWRFFLERNPALFRRQATLFAAYRADHTSFPEFWEDMSGEGRAITAPMALSKAAYLLAETSLPEPRVWSMPLARVDYLIGAIEERRTESLRFLYEQDLEAPEPLEESLSEEEIIALAQSELSDVRFQEWLEARQQSQKEAR